MKQHSIILSLCLALTSLFGLYAQDYYDSYPFGKDTEYALMADNAAIGKWWIPQEGEEHIEMREWIRARPRDKALSFALYAHDNDVLKISAQCFPLLPEEPKTITLEFKKNGKWKKVQEQIVLYPGWSSHFRIEKWDNTKDVAYRLQLGDLSSIEGLIRKDPSKKNTIVVASLNCDSKNDKTPYARTKMVENLLEQDPDLLFFAGDQSYWHDEHTYGWLQFGEHFGEVMKDRPTICIPDDHDVGHINLWGEGGEVSNMHGSPDGGYLYPPSFVNMVERCQTFNLPDAYDPTPIKQGIGVYYTDMTLGGINFAILEDRKFKTAPLGNVPKMSRRPDHIKKPYDPASIDKQGFVMLGERQLNFLDAWARDWSGAEMKVVLSQTAFTGAVHCHGNTNNRLLADLDCNGWPQTPRDNALRAIRRAHAPHLCGDQHLGVVVQHGIDEYRDGPYAFTAPAIVNTIYGRWWWPENEQAGGGTPIDSELPWVGDYKDGLANKITMLAYGNPQQINMKQLHAEESRPNRGDGYGIIRLNKETNDVIFEAWPRFADLSKGDDAQFSGWPISFNMEDNDGRKAVAYLEEVKLPMKDAVVELTNDETGELIYCYRVKGDSFKAPVYDLAKHTLKAGKNTANKVLLKNVNPK